MTLDQGLAKVPCGALNPRTLGDGPALLAGRVRDQWSQIGIVLNGIKGARYITDQFWVFVWSFEETL